MMLSAQSAFNSVKVELFTVFDTTGNMRLKFLLVQSASQMSRIAKKPVLGISDQV